MRRIKTIEVMENEDKKLSTSGDGRKLARVIIRRSFFLLIYLEVPNS